MKFSPYVISAGRRQSIITSNRREGWQQNANKDSGITAMWNALTLIGVLMAGLGFTAQYIGLRGLAYPCAIAHLSAIILMAVTRAFVRRRLGVKPLNILAIAGHELDFLAHHIVFDPNLEEHEDDLVARWGVKIRDPRNDDEHYVMSSKEIDEQSERDSENQNHAGRVKDDESVASERLLLVRKRLGDLCHWKTKASPSARSVTKSVEDFMNTFFSDKTMKSQKKVKIEWLLETWKLDKNLKMKQGFISIPITRPKSTWEVDQGKVAAVLSLWMANIEANISLKKKSPQTNNRAKDAPKQGSPNQEDWRRSIPELGSSYEYCRILGNDWNEQPLKRDLSRWVDEFKPDQSNGAVDIVIGFNGRLSQIYPCTSLDMN